MSHYYCRKLCSLTYFGETSLFILFFSCMFWSFVSADLGLRVLHAVKISKPFKAKMKWFWPIWIKLTWLVKTAHSFQHELCNYNMSEVFIMFYVQVCARQSTFLSSNCRERDPSSVALLMVSSIFFLIRVEGLQTEGVICCTDCKAPWGKLWFVILGYINKIDLTSCLAARQF